MATEILAPMPGTIINILVKEGDEVLEYQEVIILEAMKMENAIPCPEAGKIKEIKVKVDDKVATNQVLSQIAYAFQLEVIWSFAQAYALVLLLIVLGFVLHYLPPAWYNSAERLYTRSPVLVKALSLALVIWLVIQTASSDVVPFIYFQF